VGDDDGLRRCGFLTARAFADGGGTASAGRSARFADRISVNFRLPNLFSRGLLPVPVGVVPIARAGNIWQGVWFGLAFLAGIAPTLIANAVNAGEPFATTMAASTWWRRHWTRVFSAISRRFRNLSCC